MLAYVSAALVLGLSAALSPGPLLALVIAQTLSHGWPEGAKVALAPLVTDFPIILVATLVLARLANSDPVLGVVSLLGGAFVLYLAYESFRTTSLDTAIRGAAPQSLRKGVLVNALSPHPYLFWLAVGAPTILRAADESLAAAVAFVLAFLGCLVGAKIVLAVLVGRSRRWVTGRAYGLVMRGLAALLVVFALYLVRDGLALLGVL